MSDLSRRDFLKKSGIALAGMMVAPTIVPASVLGKSAGYTAPSDKLNILGVGIGGRGAADRQGAAVREVPAAGGA